MSLSDQAFGFVDFAFTTWQQHTASHQAIFLVSVHLPATFVAIYMCCCIRQPTLQTYISFSTCIGVQEALDADEHPDMMDFSDHSDGLQRADSDAGHKHSGDPTTDPTADPATDPTTVPCSADLGQKKIWSAEMCLGCNACGASRLYILQYDALSCCTIDLYSHACIEGAPGRNETCVISLHRVSGLGQDSAYSLVMVKCHHRQLAVGVALV